MSANYVNGERVKRETLSDDDFILSDDERKETEQIMEKKKKTKTPPREKDYDGPHLRFQVVSDIHAEINFSDMAKIPIQIPPKKTPVLVLAGDIYVGRRTDFPRVIDYVASKFDAVVYVPGNHEFYNGDLARDLSMDQIQEFMQRTCDKMPNVFMLQNKTAVLGGVLFVGGTGWTDVPPSLWSYTDMMNDYHAIYTTRRNTVQNSERLTPEYVYDLHKEFRFFVEDTLINRKASRGDKTVVVSHHSPSPLYKGNWNRDDAYMPYYYAMDMNKFLQPPVDVWVHGHTHTSVDDVTPQGTRIVANAVGYAYDQKELNPKYDPEKEIRV